MQEVATKFKVGDKVKWMGGRFNDNVRIDTITAVLTDLYGDTRYRTLETNAPANQTPKQGMAYESYLTLAQSYDWQPVL